MEKHEHLGTDQPKIQLKNLDGFVETVSAVPTHIPRNLYEQIKIYVSGATLRLYIYDRTNGAWRYVSLT